MKTNISLINSIGLDNASKRAWYAANVLDAATVSSTAVTVSPAIPAVTAKAEVFAQTAKPARPASVAVTAAANTVGYAFGELYLNSPAYPIGTAIPAISAKPASAAVIAKPAVIGSQAVPAVISPAVVAIAGWDMAIYCEVISSTALKITAYLPYASSPKLIGATTNGIDTVLEITPKSLDVIKWLDSGAGYGTSFTSLPKTMEQFLYQAALDLVAEDPIGNTIESVIYVVEGKPTPCHKITLNLVAADYDLTSESIQLNKVANSPIVPNSFVVGQYLTVPTMNYSGLGWLVTPDGSPFNVGVQDNNPFPVPCTLLSSF